MSSILCGQQIPCAAYFNQNPYSSIYSVIQSWDFQIKAGYNLIYLSEPFKASKGNFIAFKQTTGRIAIDKSGNTISSDLNWQGAIWSKLNSSSNWRFYLNALNNFTMYQSVFSALNQYSNIGQYNVSIRLASSNQTYYQTVAITDCKCL